MTQIQHCGQVNPFEVKQRFHQLRRVGQRSTMLNATRVVRQIAWECAYCGARITVASHFDGQALADGSLRNHD